MKVRGDDILEGAHSFVALFGQNLLLFGELFENTYRDGFYTLGRSTNSNQHSANIAHTQPVLSFPALFNLPLCTLCQGKQIKYIWFIISFKCFIAFVVEQPCVRLRGGQCFSPQKIPSLLEILSVQNKKLLFT